MAFTSPTATTFRGTNPGGGTEHSQHVKNEWGAGKDGTGVAIPVDDVDGARLPVGGLAIGTPGDAIGANSLIGQLKKIVSLVPSVLSVLGNFKTSIEEDNSGVPTGLATMANSVPTVTAKNQTPPFPDNSFLWHVKWAEADGAASDFIMHTATGGRQPVVKGYQITISEACTAPVRIYLGIVAGSLPSLGTLQSNVIFESAKLAPGTVIDINADRLATGNVGDSVKLTSDVAVGGHFTVGIRGFEELP